MVDFKLDWFLSSAVAAFLLSGGGLPALADTCAINEVGTSTGSVTNTGTINCINVQNSTVSGNVTNSAGGTINATGFFGSPTDTGIGITNNAFVGGGVSNAGAITAALAGINVFGSVFGGITNSGTIAAFAGIGVHGWVFSGGITNSGSVSTVGDGVVVGLVNTFSGGITNTGTISSGGEGILVISDTTFSGGMNNSGTISAVRSGISLLGVSTYSDGIANSGAIISGESGMLVSSVSNFLGGINNSGTISAVSGGVIVALSSSFSGGIRNSGTISAGSYGIAVGNVSNFAGDINNSGNVTSATGIRIGDGVTFTAGSTIVNSGTIIGTSGIAIDVAVATSPVTITQAGGLIGGAIKLSAKAHVLNISGGAINGNIDGAGGGTAINFALGSGGFTYNSAFSGINQVNISSGAVVLNGANIASNVDVNGGTLAGSGSIATTVMTIHSGAAFAPGTSGVAGTSMNIVGNLVFQPGSSYLTTLDSTTASRAIVTGAAALNGTVYGALLPGSSLSSKNTYHILHADSINGVFDGFINPNFAGTFTYTPTDVLLSLTGATIGAGASLNRNQHNVASTISNSFNSGSTLPAGFVGLFGLTGDGLATALTQISGETATASQQTTFDAMSQFMGVMTDPFIAGRGNPISAGGSPNAYADEAMAYAGKRRPNDALAAIYTKAPPLVPSFEQRWSVWAAGFGGSQRTDGNTIVGSNDTRSSIYGVAAGADYRLSPNTLAGFALAGGGTNFSVNGLGTGRSDLFQAGGFIRHNWGPAYITGALAYGWQDITTDRTVTVAGIDRLRAQFNANAWSGRLEGGYRFVAQGFGWTPYAAGQFTTFDLPAYAEQVVSGANTFALGYAARSVTATRGELGLRTDKSFAVQDGIFTLRGRAAWAHNFNTDRGALPTFQALPGASFVVNGAAQAADAALLTGSAEMKWINGWSVAATFEGEFSRVTESYAGKGVVRYAW